MPVKRGFVDIPDGQIHYRELRDQPGRVVVMLHSNPGSSAMLMPMIERFGAFRPVIAPDTPGFGDSSPSPKEWPQITDYATAVIAALDALGVERFDLYGNHTGANIAVEIALARPDRVGCVILDGIALYSPEMRKDLLAHYAPPVVPDYEGRHLMWTWHFVRDQWLFWPWFRRDREHRRDLSLPDPMYLHAVVLDVLKSLGTFQAGYRASFEYAKEKRLPLLRAPTMVASARTDIFFPELDQVAAFVPNVRKAVIGGESAEELDDAVALFREFLGQPNSI
jgi:pimeloyl-ACP methyl ester carboxylesterase